MSSASAEIQLIACLVAIACAIPGTFLVLRKMAMISDAISHSILPGIVVGFFITHDLNSPLLIIFSALTGIATVIIVEYIQKTRLVKEDAAIGLVFPALFSIGVVMIAKNANDVHLDVDTVLLGELAFAPFNRFIIYDTDLGPKSLWVISFILLSTIVLLITFFKELKISTFDKGLAASLGFSPAIIHYGLMSVASITTVGAFDAVGAILVIAFMIVPAAAAYLLTKDLKMMLLLAIGFGVFSAISGYWLSRSFDVSISGSMTTILGIVFMLVYLFSPSSGMIAVLYRNRRQRTEVSLLTFLLHLQNHHEEEERHMNHLSKHINWHKVRSKTVLELAQKTNMITISQDIICLTKKGEAFTKEAVSYILNNKDVHIESTKKNFFLLKQ